MASGGQKFRKPENGIEQQADARYKLGNYRSGSGALHAQLQQQNKRQIQHDVQQGRDTQKDQRGQRVTYGTEREAKKLKRKVAVMPIKIMRR